jgi:hypothetical protein
MAGPALTTLLSEGRVTAHPGGHLPARRARSHGRDGHSRARRRHLRAPCAAREQRHPRQRGRGRDDGPQHRTGGAFPQARATRTGASEIPSARASRRCEESGRTSSGACGSSSSRWACSRGGDGRRARRQSRRQRRALITPGYVAGYRESDAEDRLRPGPRRRTGRQPATPPAREPRALRWWYRVRRALASTVRAGTWT